MHIKVPRVLLQLRKKHLGSLAVIKLLHQDTFGLFLRSGVWVGASYEGELGDYMGTVVSCLPLKHHGTVLINDQSNTVTGLLASKKFVSEK